MDLTVTLKKEEWEFIFEVLNLNDTTRIKESAISLLKTPLDAEFLKKNKEENALTK